MLKSDLDKISAVHSRPEYMLLLVEAVGVAFNIDVSKHSVSGKRDGRDLPYPPEMLRVVKSRMRTWDLCLTISINVSCLDFLRMKVAKETSETFSFNFTQQEYESSCPKAAQNYDAWTGSVHGVQQSPQNLEALGRIIDTAGCPHDGSA